MSDHASRPLFTAGALTSDNSLACNLTIVGGAAGLERKLDHARIQKSGLALTGHFHGVKATRVQILGETEISYLATQTVNDRCKAIRNFFTLGLSLVVVTSSKQTPLAELIPLANEMAVPLAFSSARSSHTIAAIHLLLDERLAPKVSVHGVLVDIFGLGVLLLGKSGIGKSECALELVMRGHRLVADDIIRCDWRPPGMVFGEPADLLRHHIEVRGLGVLNVKQLLGVTAVRERKRIDLVVRVLEWADDVTYDRMGIEERTYELLEVKIREIVVPVRPGRSIASLLEGAARNELAKNSGMDGARDFFDRLHNTLVNTNTDTEGDLLYSSSVSKRETQGSRGPGL